MRTSQTIRTFFLAPILLSTLILSGCAKDPVPPSGTKVTTTSPAFKRLADDLQKDCERMGGCTCYMDGVQTTCAIVFSCLNAGMCTLVKST